MSLEAVPDNDELIAPIQEEGDYDNYDIYEYYDYDYHVVVVDDGDDEEKKAAEQALIIDSISNVFLDMPARTELLWEIFSRLPPQTLFKLKCISKNFSKLPQDPSFALMHSSRCKAIARCSFTGFFFQEITNEDDYTVVDKIMYLPTEPEADCLPDSSLMFLNQRGKEDVLELIDSCNGLVLCSNLTVTGIYTFFVCNPLTKEKVDLPHPCRRSNRVYYALMADFTSSGYLQYKVLCFFRPKQSESWSELLVLSSQTGEWHEIEARFPPICHESMMGSRVFLNGSLFWDCLEGKILVYHLKVTKLQRPWELIEAPRAPLGRCLWRFEDKLHCYCLGFPDQFPAWSLCVENKKELKWKIEDCKLFERVTKDISRMLRKTSLTGWKITSQDRFKLLGYRPESKTLLVFIPDTVYSYQVTKRKFKCLGGSRFLRKFYSLSNAVPYLHCLAPIRTEESIDRNDSTKVEAMEQGDSALDNIQEVIALYENLANKVMVRR